MDTSDPRETVRADTHPHVTVAPRALPEVPGYEVLELVGRGGMGRVYRARHLGLGRIVALKVLTQETDEHLLARFREETRAVARLQHPNIAQLYETGSANGCPYFAQEFLDGGSLARVLGGRPQPPRDGAELLETIARAVHHSHAEGILHRDLKPGNILLARKYELRSPKSETDADGRSSGSEPDTRLSDFIPKVADFGLAKTLEVHAGDTKRDLEGGTSHRFPPRPPPDLEGGTLTRTGEILGTPSYMPPEQASGVVASIGPAADVYALGAVLYELLTGHPPFQAPDAVQTLMMVLTREPVAPRSLQPDVPRDLETICLKCLEKSPKKRYASALELADDLRRFLDGRPIVARPVGTVERAVKWARRNRAAAALVAVSAVAAVLLLASGVALGVGYFRLRDALGAAKTANENLEAKNEELEQANRDTRAEKEKVEKAGSEIRTEWTRAEREKDQKQKTLVVALVALDAAYFELSDQLKELPGSEPIRLGLLKQARRTLDGLADFLTDDRTIPEYRLVGYDRLGNIESAMGDRTAAEQSYAKSRDIAVQLEGRYPDEVRYKLNRMLASAKVATIQQARGNTTACDAILDTIVPEADQLAAARPDDPKVLELLALVRLQEVHRLLRARRWDDALARVRDLCDLSRRRAKVEPNDPARRRDVIDGDRRLALALLEYREPAKTKEAGELLRHAADELAALPENKSIAARELRAQLAATTAAYYNAVMDHPAAIAAYRTAIAEYESLAAQFTHLPAYRYQQASLLYGLALPTSFSGDERGALAHLEKSEQLLAELVKQYPNDTGSRDLHERVSNLLSKIRPPKPPDKKP